MGSKPRVSIGMPVYNEELHLEQALQSLLSQSFTDFELIISDNASTDRTGEICLTYAAKDPALPVKNEPWRCGKFQPRDSIIERTVFLLCLRS